MKFDNKSLSSRFKILGVPVDNLTKGEILEKIGLFLGEDKFHQIATVNPEFILLAQKNSLYKDILNNCALNVADGTGVWFAFLRFGRYLRYRIAGADLMLEILRMAEKKGLGVYLAINKDGLSNFEEIREAIYKIHPNLIIIGADLDPSPVPSTGHPLPKGEGEDLGYNIVFCNFGAPHQEIFLNSQKNANIRLAMGVGGSFDYLTGKVRRAPKIVQKLGFEWFWRILVQPENKLDRLKRILRAVIIFPIKVIINR